MAETKQTKRSANERAVLIDLSLEIAHDLGFSLPERALLLGYGEEVGDNPEYLYRELVELGRGQDVERRCELLVGFDRLLQKVGHHDPKSKQQFVDNKRYQCLNGRTFKEWLKGGNIEALEIAVEQLTHMSS